MVRFEKEKKEMCIISLDQLKLDDDDEEVKVQDDKDDKDEDDDGDTVNVEELLDEVSELPHYGITKETEELVQKALQSAEIIKSVSKLSPASWELRLLYMTGAVDDNITFRA